MATALSNNMDHGLHTPEEYRKAIASLEASTLAIESQISISRQILDTITPKQARAPPTTTHNKHQALSAQISSQHSVLAQNLTTTSVNLKKAVSSTLITVDDTLSRDDYAFEQIAQSLSASEAAEFGVDGDGNNDQDDDGIQSRTERLLDVLIRTESEVIRTRLERVYLEILNSTTSDSNGSYHDDEDSELDSARSRYTDLTKTEILKSDLRTLYDEIDDVTAMFVAHEHGDVLNQVNQDMARARRVLSARQAEWAVERIREMTERLRGIEEGMRGVQGQRVVVRRLGGYLDELSVQSGMAVGSGRGIGGDAGVVRREVDGPALVGLRGYLGVSAGGGGRGDRIEEVFGEVKRSVEGVLNVQSEQAGMLKGTNSGKDDGQGEDGVARGYGTMLDGLNDEIARIKKSMEALPG